VSYILVSDESDAKAYKLMAVNTFDALHSAIADFLQNIESTIAFKTEKEVQLNDWVHKILTTELCNYWFQTRFSLFRRSQPNLAFSNRAKRNMVAEAVLKIPGRESWTESSFVHDWIQTTGACIKTPSPMFCQAWGRWGTN